jgi:hypothetical protein
MIANVSENMLKTERGIRGARLESGSADTWLKRKYVHGDPMKPAMEGA